MFKLLGIGLGFSVLAFGVAQAVVGYSGKQPAGVAMQAPARPGGAVRQPERSPSSQNGPKSVSLAADESGHFVSDVRINGLFVKGLFDTGATQVALPLKEARRIGIDPPTSAYTTPVGTAGGQVMSARVKLDEVRLETIVVKNVEALVIPQGLEITLVGMSFFKQLQSTEMRGAMLVLRQ